MAVEFQGYQVDNGPLQMDMPDKLAKKLLKILAEINGYVAVEESEPEDPPAA